MDIQILKFQNINELKRSNINGSRNRNVLIQIFCTEGIQELEAFGRVLSQKYPDAVIVGVTAASAVDSSRVVESGTVVSLTHFEKSKLYVAYSEGESTQVGKAIAGQLKQVSSGTQGLLLLFSDGTNTNGDLLLEGIYSVFPEVTIVGGMASVKDMKEPTAVLIGNKIIKTGAVGVLITGEMQFDTSYLFDWEEIGREHLITHSEGNRVFTIDGISAVDFYRNYLGEEVSERLPETGIEYPLVFRKKGIKVARACIKRHEDGSLTFAGMVPTGQNVKIASGSLRGFSLKEKVIKELLSIAENNETVFIYSCIARKSFLGKLVEKELEVFSPVKNVGFFTHGEFFYTPAGPLLLNETLTVVGIRESSVKNRIKSIGKQSFYEKRNDDCHSILAPITNLLHRTSSECDLIIDSISHSNIGFLVFKRYEDRNQWYCSYASDNLDKIIGCSSNELRTRILSKEEILNKLIFSKDKERVKKAVAKLSTGKEESITVDYRIVLPTEETRWIRSFVKIISRDSGKLMIHTFQDITPEKKIEYEKRKNYYLAVHDPLTKLFNRLYLISQLPRILKIHKKKDKFGGILFIDLDGFKKINDTLGHSIGDEILKEVARRIKLTIRKSDIAVRFAGDEFIVILPLLSGNRKESLNLAKQIAERVLSEITSPIPLGDVQLSIGASIGVASFSGYSTEEELLARVDHLMYKAKALGGKRFFSEDEE